MKGKNGCGGTSQGEIRSSQGEIDYRTATRVRRRAKPAFPVRVPPPSGAPAAPLPQPSSGTAINLLPQRIWRAAGYASTAPDRLQPEPAAATATATMCGAP